LIPFLAGLVVGAVAGALIYRNNVNSVAKLEAKLAALKQAAGQ